MSVTSTQIERIFRDEYGRAVSVLTRVFGDLDLAEEVADRPDAEARQSSGSAVIKCTKLAVDLRAACPFLCEFNSAHVCINADGDGDADRMHCAFGIIEEVLALADLLANKARALKRCGKLGDKIDIVKCINVAGSNIVPLLRY